MWKTFSAVGRLGQGGSLRNTDWQGPTGVGEELGQRESALSNWEKNQRWEGGGKRAPEGLWGSRVSLVVFSVSGGIFRKVPIGTNGFLWVASLGVGGGLKEVLSYSYGAKTEIIGTGYRKGLPASRWRTISILNNREWKIFKNGSECYYRDSKGYYVT